MGVNCGGEMRKNKNMEVIKRECEKRGRKRDKIRLNSPVMPGNFFYNVR